MNGVKPPIRTAKYAVFLPVRNGMDHIRKAIDSVVAQTLGDWVLIVLDNASSDGTAALVRSYQDSRISLRLSRDSLQIWESWQRVHELLAVGQVTAEYATIIGHDDYFYPGFLAEIDRLIQECPGATLFQTAFDLVDASGGLIRPCRPIPARESAEDFIASRLWGLRDSYGTGYVFRASDYVGVGGIPNLPKLLFADDLLFARLLKRGFKASTNATQCAYRLHRGSTSGILDISRLMANLEAVQAYLRHLEEEFPAFVSSSAGSSAIASLLAREVMFMRPAILMRMMPDGCRRVAAELQAMYLSLSAGADFHQWLGSNFVLRTLYPRFKQAMLFYLLARVRLSGS